MLECSDTPYHGLDGGVDSLRVLVTQDGRTHLNGVWRRGRQNPCSNCQALACLTAASNTAAAHPRFMLVRLVPHPHNESNAALPLQDGLHDTRPRDNKVDPERPNQREPCFGSVLVIG